MWKRGARPVLCLMALVPLARGIDQKADRIFINGMVWTGDAAKPRVEALAIRGPRIIALGTTGEIRKWAEKQTQVVDLKGRFVCPGFDDAHLHFLVIESADLIGAGSVAEIERRVGEFARRNPDRLWVEGGGWAYADFPANAPHRKYLDAVVADRPVILSDRDGHSRLCNSVALKVADITRATPDPAGGVIDRDASGEPTGLLKEGAVDLVQRLVPPPSDELRYQSLKKLLDRAASYGLTSVQNASFNAEDWPVFERVQREGGLKLRFYWALPFKKDIGDDELASYKKFKETYHGPMLKFGAVKGFLDGTIDNRTAALFEPYVGGGSGLPLWTQDDLNRTAALFDKQGFQILLHAIGDKAIAMALDAYEYAARVNGTTGRRHRVEHVELPRLSDLPRFKALGVIASTQPLFANPDKTVLENFAVLLGPERASHADSFKLFDDAGAVQAFGSDAPVMSMEVLKSIYCAATRQTPEGTPAGGWYPAGRISVEAALRHFTRDAAFASFDDGIKGRLAPDTAADFVVLSEDILAVAPEKLLTTRVLLTVMGGNDTYRSREF